MRLTELMNPHLFWTEELQLLWEGFSIASLFPVLIGEFCLLPQVPIKAVTRRELLETTPSTSLRVTPPPLDICLLHL